MREPEVALAEGEVDPLVKATRLRMSNGSFSNPNEGIDVYSTIDDGANKGSAPSVSCS